MSVCHFVWEFHTFIAKKCVNEKGFVLIARGKSYVCVIFEATIDLIVIKVDSIYVCYVCCEWQLNTKNDKTKIMYSKEMVINSEIDI